MPFLRPFQPEKNEVEEYRDDQKPRGDLRTREDVPNNVGIHGLMTFSIRTASSNVIILHPNAVINWSKDSDDEGVNTGAMKIAPNQPADRFVNQFDKTRSRALDTSFILP